MISLSITILTFLVIFTGLYLVFKTRDESHERAAQKPARTLKH